MLKAFAQEFKYARVSKSMAFLLDLVILLVGAKALGEAAERLRMPSIVGYLAAGVLLAPILGLLRPEEEIGVFAQLGAVLLLFTAGLREIRLGELLENKTATIGTAVFAYLFPMIAVVWAIHAFQPGLLFEESLVLLTAVAIPSVVASVKALIALNSLNTPAGRVVLSSAAVATLAGLFIFTIIAGVLKFQGPALQNIVGISALTAALFLVFALGEKLLPSVLTRTALFEVEEAQFTMIFVVMLALVFLATSLGLNGLIGAYLAGIIISKTHLRERGFYEKLAALTYGIFVPVLYAWVGAMATAAVTPFTAAAAAGVLAAALAGGWLGAFLGGAKADEAALVGASVMPRGGIDVILIATAITAGLLTPGGAAIIVTTMTAIIVASVVIGPVLLRLFTRQAEGG
jgi:Kef-type K+ transport system membrane component KefB